MACLLALGPDYDEKKITALIIHTFYSQRRDINNGLSIEEMFKSWPAIFTEFGFQKHFELLVGIALKENFFKKLECKGEVLIKTIKSVLKTSNKDMLAIMCEIKKFEEVMPIPSASVLIVLLMAYFKEDKQSIFRLTNISTTRAEALKMDLPATPCIIVCGLELFNAERFMLCNGGYIVNDSITNFTDAFLMLFASFYVFNICYPAAASSTLQFIQRCFASINPSRGSKKNQSKGKKASIDPKVVTLVNIVADQEWLNC
ncbi:hypothetical protein AVEN_172221-1 [Araneus ventricosus]|uniref:Uncharacterized protein n=1 Tax=Araneus ventricosus TaxID=182803 RepID=A0A4Y2UW76_ARAVE|nr:hypothetical protein AVEN_172221-1 [Araneus ventricosus]